MTWQNPEQLFVAQELINKVKSKCCGIKEEDKYGCKEQIYIKAFPLDEVTKAIASLIVIIKIYPVLMYHGISQDNT